MATFQKFSPSAKNFMVPKVTVRPPSGRWTSRSVDKGEGYQVQKVSRDLWLRTPPLGSRHFGQKSEKLCKGNQASPPGFP